MLVLIIHWRYDFHPTVYGVTKETLASHPGVSPDVSTGVTNIDSFRLPLENAFRDKDKVYQTPDPLASSRGVVSTGVLTAIPCCLSTAPLAKVNLMQ
jgi:hypothetical protein